MILLALLIQTAAAPAKVDPPHTVVVTAKPLAQTQRALDECLARSCPAKEDIEATLAHAENQFVAGEYLEARRTLRLSRERNARFAKDLPVEVADLTRAYGRMTTHDGSIQTGRILQIDALDALKSGLPSDDKRILAQRALVGDEFARAGRYRAALDTYQRVERQARKKGLSAVEGYAMIRQAALNAAISSVRPEYRQAANASIARIESTTNPALADYRTIAGVLRAKLAAERNDNVGLEQSVAALAARQINQPVLISAPPLVLDQRQTERSRFSTSPPTAIGKPQWIDVGFVIRPDGTTEDVTILRQSEGDMDENWPSRVTKTVAGRRYLPMTLPAGSPVLIRTERFTYVRDRTTHTGSRMTGREGVARVHSLDLTSEAPQPRKANPAS